MKHQTAAIGFLSITAALMFAVCVFVDKPAHAEVAVQDSRGEYFVMTNAGTGGSDVLYIADGRRGIMAVFVWDNSSRSLQVRAVQPIPAAFR